MDAPLYPPATRFVQPTRVARILSTRDTAITDLEANPQAWAIVMATAPEVAGVIGNAMLKPHLGNFCFADLVQFGAVKSANLDAIDAQLRALGPVL